MIVTIQLINLLLGHRILDVLLAENAWIIQLIVLEGVVIGIWFLVLVQKAIPADGLDLVDGDTIANSISVFLDSFTSFRAWV